MPSSNEIYRISDSDLVQAYRNGCRDAGGELVNRYRGAVSLVARQETNSKEIADDVVQDAFLQAFKHLGNLKQSERFAPWLCTITRNLARRMAQRAHRDSPCEDSHLNQLLESLSHGISWDPLAIFIKKEEEEELKSVLLDLSQPLQLVMKLYYYQQWDVAQISEFLSLTRTTVKWRLHAGRKEMLALIRQLDQPTTQQNGETIT